MIMRPFFASRQKSLYIPGCAQGAIIQLVCPCVCILPLYHKLGYLNLYGPLTVSDLFFDFFVEIFGVF